MCGRFTLRTPAADLIEIFEVARSFELTPRYNIAPTQQVAAVREVRGARELVQLRWGLLPSWSDAATSGPPMINARSETAAAKPAVAINTLVFMVGFLFADGLAVLIRPSFLAGFFIPARAAVGLIAFIPGRA